VKCWARESRKGLAPHELLVCSAPISTVSSGIGGARRAYAFGFRAGRSKAGRHPGLSSHACSARGDAAAMHAMLATSSSGITRGGLTAAPLRSRRELSGGSQTFAWWPAALLGEGLAGAAGLGFSVESINQLRGPRPVMRPGLPQNPDSVDNGTYVRSFLELSCSGGTLSGREPLGVRAPGEQDRMRL
jgi:hypothetical protein